jgi:hypothetical protein
MMVEAGGTQEEEMANYLLTYRGGSMPATPDEQAGVMAAWTAWFEQLGSALVDGGNPTTNSRTIESDGTVGPEVRASVSGYSVISADSLDAAVELAKGCPVVLGGASIEVCETFAVM